MFISKKTPYTQIHVCIQNTHTRKMKFTQNENTQPLVEVRTYIQTVTANFKIQQTSSPYSVFPSKTAEGLTKDREELASDPHANRTPVETAARQRNQPANWSKNKQKEKDSYSFRVNANKEEGGTLAIKVYRRRQQKMGIVSYLLCLQFEKLNIQRKIWRALLKS